MFTSMYGWLPATFISSGDRIQRSRLFSRACIILYTVVNKCDYNARNYLAYNNKTANFI